MSVGIFDKNSKYLYPFETHLKGSSSLKQIQWYKNYFPSFIMKEVVIFFCVLTLILCRFAWFVRFKGKKHKFCNNFVHNWVIQTKLVSFLSSNRAESIKVKSSGIKEFEFSPSAFSIMLVKRCKVTSHIEILNYHGVH